jgi:mannose-6-phosphate isomerase-like protein (cupin superfamily)
MAALEKVTLSAAFRRVAEPWHPVLAGEVNGQLVKLARLAGPFIWHHHEAEDELFLVVSGRLRMELRDRTVVLGPGEFLVVPRGVEHRPVGDPEAEVFLVEPASTVNTGNVRNERTVTDLPRL